MRVSSVPRLLIELGAGGATARELHPLLEQAIRRQLLDVPDLARTLQRNYGRAGIGVVQALCEEYLPHTERKSGLERAFDRWLLKHPEIPPPERNVRLGPWEIDCYWPQHQLVLELDGRAYHTVVEEIERDRRKDAWLQAHGKRILRVTDTRFRVDKTGVHRDLSVLLALASAQHSDQQRPTASSRGPLSQAVQSDGKDVLPLARSRLLDLGDPADQLDHLGEVGVGADAPGFLRSPENRLTGDEQIRA